MDRNEGRIILAIPTIDLLECRKFKGGYHEDNAEMLDPAYCEDDYPEDSYHDADDGWLPDYSDQEDYMDHQDSQDMDNYYEQYERGEDAIDGNDGGDESESDKIKCDDSVPKEIQDLLDSLLDRLPPDIANQNVRIISNQELLNSLTHSDGQEAKGAFLPAGHVLPNGNVLNEDTVVLGNGADMSTVQEELIHCWQVNNCIENGASIDDVLSAMEFQASIIEAIDILENSDGIINLPYGIPGEFAEFYYSLPDFQNDNGEMELDYDAFIEKMDQFYDYWLGYYDGESYGQGTDENYNWNWDIFFDFYINK